MSKDVEGYAEVPGARLRYRLAGTQTALPLLVFENGWGASYEYWARVESELSSHSRLLFYDRAGIGGSVCFGPQTVTGLSDQLAGLLAALEIRQPVVLVGHSYGGLMCAVHAAQQPEMVRALVELDSSPGLADPLLDQQMKMVFWVAQLAILCARLGIPDPLFCPSGKRLPSPYGRLLVERSFGSARSLRAAVDELQLLNDLRVAIARGDGRHPHLLLSAGQAAQLKGLAGRVLAAPERAKAIIQHMQDIHRQRASMGRDGHWDSLPHDHGSLVFSEEGARDSAARTLRFLREYC